MNKYIHTKKQRMIKQIRHRIKNSWIWVKGILKLSELFLQWFYTFETILQPVVASGKGKWVRKETGRETNLSSFLFFTEVWPSQISKYEMKNNKTEFIRCIFWASRDATYVFDATAWRRTLRFGEGRWLAQGRAQNQELTQLSLISETSKSTSNVWPLPNLTSAVWPRQVALTLWALVFPTRNRDAL